MKKVFSILLALLPTLAFGQTHSNNQQVLASGGVNFGNGTVFSVRAANGAPTGSCQNVGLYIQLDATPGANDWQCINGSWIQQTAISGTTSNISGGTAGAIVFQSAPGITTFLSANGTTNVEFLSSVNGGNPSYVGSTGTGTVVLSNSPTFSGTITTGLSTGGVVTTTSGGVLGSSALLPTTSIPALTGDLFGTAGSASVTVSKVNGTSIPTNSTADQTIVTTASATGSWASIPNCGSSSTALAYSTSTHTFSCQTISTGSAIGGSNTQLQYNNAGVLGGISGWTTNGTTTLSAGTTSILDLHAATSASDILLPGALSTGILRVTTSTGAVSSAEISGDCTTSGSNAITCTKTNGNAFTSASYTTIGTSGATIPLLNGANTYSGASTFSAAITDSVAGAASSSPILLTGAILTGGTGTTNFPALFVQPTSATAATTWSTAGTIVGINTATGFTGNFLDFHINGGSSIFNIASTGNVTGGTYNTATLSGGTLSSTAVNGVTTANIVTGSSLSTNTLLVGNGGTAITTTTTGTGVITALGSSVNTSGGLVTSNNPTFTGTFTATNIIGLGAIAQSGANTVLGNFTNSIANNTANSLPSCSTASSALLYTSGTGFSCNTSITAASVPASGLTGTTLASGVTSSSLTSLSGGTVGTAAYVNTGTSGATVPLLNGTNTYSGASTFSATVTHSAAGAASSSPLLLSGAIFTGGTGTTNFPALFVQPSAATAATTWSTAGTIFGVNTATGFTGNFLDFHINGGSSVFNVASTGNVTGGTYNTATLSGGTLSSTAVNGITTANIVTGSSLTTSTLLIGNSGTAITTTTTGTGVLTALGSGVNTSGGLATSNNPTFSGTLTTPLTTAGVVSASSGGVLSSAATITASEMLALGGDLSGTAGSASVTVLKVNGTTIPTNSAADQTIVTTASATGSWTSIPNCGSSTSALAYSTSTHTFSCQSITGSASAGGSNTQLQYNNASALGGITGWTTNGTTTLTAGTTSVLDLHAATSTSDILLPGALPTGLVRVTTSTGVVSSSELSGDCTTSGSNAITCTKTNGNAFTSASYTAIGTSGATIPLLNGTNTYSGASTFSAAITDSTAGAASSSPLLFSGSVFTGGTGTTNFPALFVQPSAATAATTWSTAGTIFGVNTATGFTGNFLDFHINGGSSVFNVASTGNVTGGTYNTATLSGGTLSSTAVNGVTTANIVTGSSLTASTLMVGNGGTAITTTTTGTGVIAALGSAVNTSGGLATSNNPTFSGTFTATNVIGLGAIAQSGANTVIGNFTNSTANNTAISLPSCSTAASALLYTSGTGFSCNTSITAASVPASGITGTTLASGVTSSSLTTLGGGTVGTAAYVNTGTSGASIPLLNGANTYSGASTFSAAITDSVAGAASSSPILLTGAILTGGTGTTNFPALFVQPSAATAVTTWSTAGTIVGINTATGFTGNFLDFHINGGSSVFGVASTGNVTGGTYNTATLSGGTLSSTAVNGVTTANIVTGSSLTASTLLIGNGGTAITTTTTGTGVIAALGSGVNTSGGLATSNNPTFTGTFTATNVIGLGAIAQSGANTVIGNFTGATANNTANSLPSCSTAASALLYTSGTGFSCNTSITAAAVPASGLTGTTLASGVTSSSLTSLGGGTVGTAAYVNTGTSGATIPLLNGANTYSGASTFSATVTHSAAGAASTAADLWSGTIFTGGTGTTNFPALFVQPSAATAATTWSTAGTIFGVNTATGFTGNFLDFHINGGSSVFNIASTGNVTGGTYNTATLSGGTLSSTAVNGITTANIVTGSSLSASTLIVGNSGTSITTTTTGTGVITALGSGVNTAGGLATSNNPTFSGTITTPLTTAGVVSASSGGVLSSAATITAAEMLALGGDLSGTAGSASVTVSKVNGTSIPTNSTADQTIVTTASATGSWTSIPNCGSSSTALSYSTSTHSFGCQSISGGSGSGTVNSGTAGQLAYYATTTTAVSGENYATLAQGGTNQSSQSFTALTDSSAITWANSGALYNNATLTLNHTTGTRSLTETGLVAGNQFTIEVTQDATGGALLTSSTGSGCTWLNVNGGNTFPIATAASAVSIISGVYDGTNCLYSVSTQTTTIVGNLPKFSDTVGDLADSGTALSSLAPLVSPAFTTPNLGAATATSVGFPATSSTVGIDQASSGVLEVNNGTSGNANGSIKVTNVTASGGMSTNIQTKTTAYTATASDYALMCNSASSMTITLPTSGINTGQQYLVKNINTGTCNVQAASGNIDNVISYPLTQWQSVTVIYNGTQYYIF